MSADRYVEIKLLCSPNGLFSTEMRNDIFCVEWWLFGAIGKRYKLFLMGNEAKTDGVGIFVAEKWADSVVRVERHSERILVMSLPQQHCRLKGHSLTNWKPMKCREDQRDVVMTTSAVDQTSCCIL